MPVESPTNSHRLTPTDHTILSSCIRAFDWRNPQSFARFNTIWSDGRALDKLPVLSHRLTISTSFDLKDSNSRLEKQTLHAAVRLLKISQSQLCQDNPKRSERKTLSPEVKAIVVNYCTEHNLSYDSFMRNIGLYTLYQYYRTKTPSEREETPFFELNLKYYLGKKSKKTEEAIIKLLEEVKENDYEAAFNTLNKYLNVSLLHASRRLNETVAELGEEIFTQNLIKANLLSWVGAHNTLHLLRPDFSHGKMAILSKGHAILLRQPDLLSTQFSLEDITIGREGLAQTIGEFKACPKPLPLAPLQILLSHLQRKLSALNDPQFVTNSLIALHEISNDLKNPKHRSRLYLKLQQIVQLDNPTEMKRAIEPLISAWANSRLLLRATANHPNSQSPALLEQIKGQTVSNKLYRRCIKQFIAIPEENMTARINFELIKLINQQQTVEITLNKLLSPASTPADDPIVESLRQLAQGYLTEIVSKFNHYPDPHLAMQMAQATAKLYNEVLKTPPDRFALERANLLLEHLSSLLAEPEQAHIKLQNLSRRITKNPIATGLLALKIELSLIDAKAASLLPKPQRLAEEKKVRQSIKSTIETALNDHPEISGELASELYRLILDPEYADVLFKPKSFSRYSTVVEGKSRNITENMLQICQKLRACQIYNSTTVPDPSVQIFLKSAGYKTYTHPRTILAVSAGLIAGAMVTAALVIASPVIIPGIAIAAGIGIIAAAAFAVVSLTGLAWAGWKNRQDYKKFTIAASTPAHIASILDDSTTLSKPLLGGTPVTLYSSALSGFTDAQNTTTPTRGGVKAAVSYPEPALTN